MKPFNLRFCTENGKTLTKIPVSKRNALEAIVFSNDSKRTLTIELDKETLLDEKKNLVKQFKVGANESRNFKIILAGGASFKYSATIEGAETDDPIIILED